MQHVLGGTIYQQTRKIMESNVVDEKVTTAEISRDIQFEWTETVNLLCHTHLYILMAPRQ
jgi:hypothetical protein